MLSSCAYFYPRLAVRARRFKAESIVKTVSTALQGANPVLFVLAMSVFYNVNPDLMEVKVVP